MQLCEVKSKSTYEKETMNNILEMNNTCMSTPTWNNFNGLFIHSNKWVFLFKKCVDHKDMYICAYFI